MIKKKLGRNPFQSPQSRETNPAPMAVKPPTNELIVQLVADAYVIGLKAFLLATEFFS